MEEKNVCASESGELKTLEVASPEIPMTKGAMRYLVELGKQTKDFEVVEIGGRIFTNTGTDGTLEEITPFETECPPSFETATLDGLVTWLHADVDKLFGRRRLRAANSARLFPALRSGAERPLLVILRDLW